MNQDEKLRLFIEFATKERHQMNKYAAIRLGNEGEDCVQDSLLRIYQNLNKFGKPYDFHAWAWKIFTNTIKNYYNKKNNKRKRIPQNMLVPLENVRDKGVQQKESMWDDDMIKIINKVPALQKESFMLCVLRGYSYADAAEKLGIHYRTVGTRIHRARKCLREFFNKK